MTPLGELIRPCGGELRAAQAFRIFRRKGLRDRTILPFEPSACGRPERGRASCGCTAISPDTPSIITSRVSCSVSPISAMRRSVSPSCFGALAISLIHSAPARGLARRRARRSEAMWSRARRYCRQPAAVDARARKRRSGVTADGADTRSAGWRIQSEYPPAIVASRSVSSRRSASMSSGSWS